MIVNEEIVVKWNPATKKHYESLGYTYTKLGEEFTVQSIHLPKGSDLKVRFICDFCKGENQINEKDKRKRYADLNKYREKTGKDSCNHPDCKKKKSVYFYDNKDVERSVSLGYKYPHLTEEWSSKNEKSPYQYSAMSHKTVWWDCPVGHEYDMKISDRTHLNCNCPYCSGKRVDSTNSLGDNYPELLEEWHLELNTLSPYEVAIHSNKTVWWKCNKGHEWEAIINNRVHHGNNCPYCSGNRICEDNCLAATHPHIVEEWNYEKNIDITPYEVSHAKHIKVWWICKKCNHEWDCLLISRTYSETGSPVCNESKGEKRVRKYLESTGYKFKPQFEFEGLVGLRGGILKFDFAILDIENNIKFLIEYDGEYHFGKIYENDGYERLIEHDRRKNEYCKSNNIPLLRIPYWDFDRIEEIISDFIHISKLIKSSELNA